MEDHNMNAKEAVKEVLTKEEKALVDAQVAAVKKEIEDAAALREANGVVETKEETKLREDEEAKKLAEAKHVITPEQKIHLDARDARVKAVKDAIAAAKELRDAAEKNGTMETPGHKLDREAKEKKDLAEASIVNVIEPFKSESNQADVLIIADKVNEIIAFLNKKTHKGSN